MRGWLPFRRRPTPVPAVPASPLPELVVHKPAPKKAAAQKPKVRPIVVVTVLGLQGDALTEVIRTVIAECDQAATRPLFITDGSSFGPFRSGRSLFEQVIDVAVCSARRPELDWRAYGEMQYRLIGRKWKPVTTVAFGRPPDPAFVEAMMQGVREKL
ncbi:MAG TPA: hypothetical protein VHL31_19725, partial [Geminicoccus sp.]|jgi:hypothetical protein|uniref:hypothetical protein n=1 Tax=Geminicoccus sp. TaxID=2024832 RepID=UPI002E33F363